MPIEALSIDSAVFWTHIGAAALCGIIIGVERQLRGKAAGVRTCTLICVGTELFVSLGASFPAATADPTRVLGQVITGIGFLGAGAILAKEGRILGLTSAAVIWMLAAIGSAIGVGYVKAGLVLTLVTLVVLIGVEKLAEVAQKFVRKGSKILETAWIRLKRGSVDRELDHLELRTSGNIPVEPTKDYREP